MSVLQKLTNAFGCSERHVERLLLAKKPLGFFRRGARGRWRVRGPLTARRLERLGQQWGLEVRGAAAELLSGREDLKNAAAYIRKLSLPVAAVMEFHHTTLANEQPDASLEPEKFRDWWELPLGAYIKKYLPQVARGARRDWRLVALEGVVRRLVNEGFARPKRKAVAKIMGQPLRTHFHWYTPSQFKQARGRANQSEKPAQNKVEVIVAALARLGGESDRPEDIARILNLTPAEFFRQYGPFLSEAYRAADKGEYEEQTPFV
jgi:hypothetical protein